MSASARSAPLGLSSSTRSLYASFGVLLAVGIVMRLLLFPSTGFHNDIAAFEAWTIALGDNPPWAFYAKTSFADYPPGYFVVLIGLAWIYKLGIGLHLISTTDSSFFALRMLVKIPALLMDCVDAVLIFAIAWRYATESIALGTAAFFFLNPATLYVSAFWGQVDSVSWGLVLLALWFALRASDAPEKTVPRLVWAWLALGLSVLIKPQGALVGLMLLAFAFTAPDALARAKRFRGTAFGIGAALVLAWLITALFHGTLNPLSDVSWLVERYRFGSGVYPYNSVNAFNLYAIKQPFWQPDLAPLTIGLFGLSLNVGPLAVWGVILVLAATALIVTRYLQQRDDRAFLEGAMLVAFAFFVLATRMHERYIFGAFLLSFPLIAFTRRAHWVALALSITTLANLSYSLVYQSVMEAHTPGADPSNLWGVGSHLIAIVNVALFFGLGYLYLGGSSSALESLESNATTFGLRARTWFDPREGIAHMSPRDRWIAFGFILASFAICIAWIQWPAEKIFDEVYYPRAGEEYLTGKEIFEYTHPPLTKLLITLSMLLFGGMHGLGDTAVGWRFLNVVVGALEVGTIYAFAKHLTRSTFFAAVAAFMLLFDGFHFVQSRISTPEVTVAFFSLCTLYAFYRLWTLAGARRAAAIDLRTRGRIVFGTIMLIGVIVGAGIATLLVRGGQMLGNEIFIGWAWIVAFAWVVTLAWLIARWATSTGRAYLDALFGRVTPTSGSDGNPFVVSYADGSRIRYAEDGAGVLALPDGSQHPLASAPRGAAVVSIDDGDVTRTFARDGVMTYATQAGTAAFEPTGEIAIDGERTNGRGAWVWLLLVALFGGALAASKWNGLFDFFVVWGCTAFVAAQRFIRKPALYGNPFGIPLDIIVGVMFVVGGGMYALTYLPYYHLGHSFVDMVGLQHGMYQYHSTLVATHPYSSVWWQWPILQRPISYFYQDYLPHKLTQKGADCCVAEILALPNPFVWWAGLATVPIVAVLAWLERHRGYALIVVAYLLQWLPWIGSPRLAFEYHFYPNLALIVLANTIVLQRLWQLRPDVRAFGRFSVAQVGVGAYLAIVLGAFIFFYPVLAGVHMTYDAWHQRMWIDRWII